MKRIVLLIFILASAICMAQTTNYIPKFNSSTTFNNSAIYQNNSNIGIGTTSPLSKLHVIGIKPAEITSVSITNSAGMEVYYSNVFSKEINLSNLQSGVYTISLQVGNKVLTSNFTILL